MEILGVTEAQFFAFVLVLFRMASLFAFAPVYSSPFVPNQVKAAAALGLSASLVALGAALPVPIPSSPYQVVLLLAQEMILGFAAGYVARLVFAAVQFGGQLAGFQMGLGIVSVMDPQFEEQISIISQIEFLLATLLFLAIGGDRLLLEVFARHLEVAPPGRMAFGEPAMVALVRLTGEIFRVGLMASAPVVVALFGTHVILGVFARSVPQMNMLILGFPLQILVGFTVLGLSLPHWGRFVVRSLADTFEALRALPAVFR
ncbi:MAG: flagellar biosynthetic protein FliR [Deferrisomatales bacterium]